MTTTAADVVVIGGGPAGSATAIRLARAGADVTVVDRSPVPAQHRFGETLPPHARPLLAACGVLDEVARNHRPAHANESAWGSDTLASHDFIFHPNGNGWHLDRAEFDALMLARAREAGARVLHGARFTTASREGESWRLGLADHPVAELETPFVIDASGRHAMFASRQHADRVVYDDLVALAATFESAGPDVDSATLIEAAGNGWWYTAAIPRQRRVAVFHTDKDLLDPQAREAGGFHRLLASTMHVQKLLCPPAFRLAGTPRLLAANSTRLEWAVGAGWAAVGDACAAFDPLSSQGIMTALGDAIRLADAWLAGHEETMDETMDEYARFLDIAYSEYLEMRARYYGAERRWTTEPFWRRRQ